jgi:threonine synthase
VFFETAHPTKFLDIVEAVVKKEQVLPPQIKSVMGKIKEATTIVTYEDLKHYLLNS